MKVAVLGARGMLGHTLLHYLRQQDCLAVPFNERWTPQNASQTLRLLEAIDADACVNAIGVVPGKGVNLEETFWINGIFPGWLAKRLPKKCTLIHASSDGVFEANAKGCGVDHPQSPDTDYGRSKRQGELGLVRGNDIIIRASIIGLEAHYRRSLLSWFLSQSGHVVGFTNHIWNGITTLEWSKVCYDILNGTIDQRHNIIQPGFLPPISKYSLLKMAARIFKRDISLTPQLADNGVQRSLIPNLYCKSIENQLCELRDWWPERGV